MCPQTKPTTMFSRARTSTMMQRSHGRQRQGQSSVLLDETAESASLDQSLEPGAPMQSVDDADATTRRKVLQPSTATNALDRGKGETQPRAQHGTRQQRAAAIDSAAQQPAKSKPRAAKSTAAKSTVVDPSGQPATWLDKWLLESATGAASDHESSSDTSYSAAMAPAMVAPAPPQPAAAQRAAANFRGDNLPPDAQLAKQHRQHATHDVVGADVSMDSASGQVQMERRVSDAAPMAATANVSRDALQGFVVSLVSHLERNSGMHNNMAPGR